MAAGLSESTWWRGRRLLLTRPQGSNDYFKAIVPWLLLLAATLFLLQPTFVRWFGHKDETAPPACGCGS